MSLTRGQVTTARLLVRSLIKGALEVENGLDELLEKQQGNIKGIIEEVGSLLEVVKAAQGSLVEQPDPQIETAPTAPARPAAAPTEKIPGADM